APIEGAVERSEVAFSHHMAVTRIHEPARVTQPYTDDQWGEVLKLGQRVDQDLQSHDVRLTMGGEPTFVATENRDAAEWNTEALGPSKRNYATELVHKLRAQYGQGGFLHFGQGKWYPGEPLPRWALSIFWRKDGQPAWQDPQLFASESQPEHCRYTSEDAQRFTRALAHQLGLDGQYITAGYEDTFYYLWRERRLPVNVDPFESKLDDAMERERLRRIFAQGLQAQIGYVLPLQAQDPSQLSGPRWLSGPWFFRDERMYLLPGDSPMGYRLPLDALPWLSKTDRLQSFEVDPFAPRAPLPSSVPLRAQRPTADSGADVGAGLPAGAAAKAQAASALGGADARALSATAGAAAEANADAQAGGPGRQRASAQRPADSEPPLPASAPVPTRTALCVEVRDPARAHGPSAKTQVEQRQRNGERGAMYVFMPPLSRLEDYLALLQAVEATARELGVRIVLEGYPPPRDPRLQVLQVTPDPGVIEVNIHPAHDWEELVEHTEFLYQAAHETRLAAEKFMTDGRHTGTGGGNHFVLGAATPADSPFLRKPELLGSLIAHWHNHPCLSYLFSGLFIGPTSQAPRVDEARNDQLRELEIALQQIAQQRQQHGQHMAPWLVDRTLRNILVDVTGNTHRSEFCIDKLYSPDSSTGRLGLLELRAFEMPPHARMSIVQQLLLRALVSRFWQQPARPRLSRWGTALHDRFLLPTFVRMDLEDVLHELTEFGYTFPMQWFEPHLEFRFPLIGQIHHRGITLSLRTALEPWHVMGEEGSSGGTVRYVDSSLERIEVRLQGLNRERYAVTVNGRPLPLHNTGTVGDFVAGVRFKAWNPPSALHPSIAVHAPLTFDIVDTWNERSLGGCQYHVAHPGGRNYDSLPVNSYEAEARRLMRFFQLGHTPGRLVVPAEPLSQEFPVTLDLRQQG
ncbi:MAG: transglutaminase family protein, partial [Betaproteobacteria bacterium]